LNNFLYDLGIGYALAKEFLKAGDNVLICSRSGVDKQTLAISICFNFAIYLFHAIYL
jgi:NAD(P)-dependent dehydrogenase (short-subunit alcohol dehydrogenase family)